MRHVSAAQMLGLMLLTATPALADAPPAPPQATVCSLNGKVCVTREPDRHAMLIWRHDSSGARKSELWRAPLLASSVQISDDGQTLVEIYPGANLLEMSAPADTAVLTFHRRARPPVAIRLNQVVAHPSTLPLTVSHRQWASTYGFDGAQRYVLETAEGRRFLFDCMTERLIEGRLEKP